MIYYKYVNKNNPDDIQEMPYQDETERANKTPAHLTEEDYTITNITSEVAQQVTNRNARNYLASTDWYVIRQAEGGPAIPENISTARQAARDSVVD